MPSRTIRIPIDPSYLIEPAAAPRAGETPYVRTESPSAMATSSARPAQAPASVRMSGPTLSISDIVRQGEWPVRAAPPEFALLADRGDVSRLGLADLIDQIRSRIELYHRNLRGIAYATVAATNALHTWKAERGWPSDRQLDNLHKTLNGLYEQERAERVTLWRDVSRLRQALPESAQLYLASIRKLDLLRDAGGDGP